MKITDMKKTCIAHWEEMKMNDDKELTTRKVSSFNHMMQRTYLMIEGRGKSDETEMIGVFDIFIL